MHLSLSGWRIGSGRSLGVGSLLDLAKRLHPLHLLHGWRHARLVGSLLLSSRVAHCGLVPSCGGLLLLRKGGLGLRGTRVRRPRRLTLCRLTQGILCWCKLALLQLRLRKLPRRQLLSWRVLARRILARCKLRRCDLGLLKLARLQLARLQLAWLRRPLLELAWLQLPWIGARCTLATLRSKRVEHFLREKA